MAPWPVRYLEYLYLIYGLYFVYITSIGTKFRWHATLLYRDERTKAVSSKIVFVVNLFLLSVDDKF